MLDIDTELAKYIQDYKIHVFDIAYLDDELIESFTSDFREIARFFKKKRLGENPLTSENELKHPHAIMEFISVFTQDKSYIDSMNHLENVSRTGGAVTMCAVAEALKTEGRKEGRLEGKVELLLEMNFSVAEIADKLGISVETTEETITKMQEK